MESGFWAFLGGTISPLNSSGSQLITEPTTIEIIWQANFVVPIIAIVIILLVIGGIIYLVYWLRSRRPRTVTQPSARTRAKKTSSKTGKSTTRKRTTK
jgi:heme/copper-type cytochrome/quinol oxidase subunit 2